VEPKTKKAPTFPTGPLENLVDDCQHASIQKTPAWDFFVIVMRLLAAKFMVRKLREAA